MHQRGEALQCSDEALRRNVEARQQRDEAIHQSDEAKQQSDKATWERNEALNLRNQELQKSEKLVAFVKGKASGVKKIRVNGKEITARLIRVLLEVEAKGGAHAFELRESLGIPRSTMDRSLRFLQKMNWVRLEGSRKFGGFVLTEEGKSAIEKFGKTGE